MQKCDLFEYHNKSRQELIALLSERDEQILALQEAVTRHKCSELKQQQLVKSLQEKISRVTPKTADTASSFMMPSEFKQRFETLMTATLPSVLGSAMHLPKLFCKCVGNLIVAVRDQIRQRLQQIEERILKVLTLDTEARSLVKPSVLKILQQNWQRVFPFALGSLHYEDKSGAVPADVLSQLNQAIGDREGGELVEELHVLCVYMQLQEKEWSWVGLNEPLHTTFSKKQHICMDGWIKEQDSALMVLKGIQRDNHMHANLKNYVIPYSPQDSQEPEQYPSLFLKQQQSSNGEIPSDKNRKAESPEIEFSLRQSSASRSSTAPPQYQQNSTQPTTVLQQIILTTEQQTNYPLASHKQNRPPMNSLLHKKKEKQSNQQSLEESLQAIAKSPKHKHPKLREEKGEKKKKISNNSLQDKLMQIGQERVGRKASGYRKVHAQAIIDDCTAVGRFSKNEDLPVSKEIPLRKRTRPATSRKNSVGKIISQQCHPHNKQNSQILNGSCKLKVKEKFYKDMIKEKLLEEGGTVKVRTDRGRKEDRPLKLQNNASKLRQKYIY